MVPAVQQPAMQPAHPPAEPPHPLAAPRVLVLTTDIGEGHDLPARELAAALGAECPDAEVVVADGLAAMGRLLETIVKDQSRLIFGAPRWMFDLEYRVFSRWRATRATASGLNYALGARGLLRLIRAHRPDIVVSTYPGTTAVLGILRRRGRLDVPACAVITDLAALRFWAHPGVDLTLVTHAESIDEVRSISPDTDVRWVRGLTGPGFTEPGDAAAGRRLFALPAGAPVVTVSGGGWAVGDLEGATEAALEREDVHAVVLCGRNDEVRARMSERFAGHPRAHVVGFTDHMSELLAATDVLIHSTAGLTVLEAHLRGCRVISYGWGIAHIRDNNRAFERHGIARVARSRAELRSALAASLAEERRERHETYAALPSAASVVLDAAAVAAR
jgi:processive 1,2-diacylglycerol beta-glucosyltransferase